MRGALAYLPIAAMLVAVMACSGSGDEQTIDSVSLSARPSESGATPTAVAATSTALSTPAVPSTMASTCYITYRDGERMYLAAAICGSPEVRQSGTVLLSCNDFAPPGAPMMPCPQEPYRVTWE